MTFPGFELFLGAWNDRQSQSTPLVHQHMARWLARHSHLPALRLLLLAFRGCGKSTLLGLYCTWRLLLNPDLRILIVAADENLAENMVRHIRGLLETHPLLSHLVPTQKNDWATDRLTVRRTHIGRDPSLRAAGIYSNITGSRADLIICDDIEVIKTADTAAKRAALKQKLHELDFILVPGGGIVYLGTPHTEESLYKTEGFLQSYQRLEVPLTEQSWPERFPAKVIAALQRAVGPRVFAAQMLLQPTQLHDARLDPDQLRFYDHQLEIVESNGQFRYFLNGQLLRGVRCWWDPAFAGADKGDRSVVALALVDAQQRMYIHDLLYMPVAPADSEAAGFQCTRVARFLQKYELHHIAVEANGLGRFLPGLLRQHLQQINYACAVQLVHQHTNKNQRLLHAFEARLHAGALWAHSQVKNTPLPAEMRAWNPERNDNDDDGMDAAAGAISMLPQTQNNNAAQTFTLMEAD